MSAQLRSFVYESDERIGVKNSRELLSVSQTRGVIPRSEITDNEARADSFEKYKVVEVGDIVLNRFNAYRGSLGTSSISGMVSPDYAVLRPNNGHSSFLEYWLRSDEISQAMKASMGGLGASDPDSSGFSRVDVRALLRLPIKKIEPGSFDPIAEFLDRETTQIDALIEKQQQLIETLSERRNAVIIRAVTRGLKNNQEFRATGLEWLPQIPAEWKEQPFFTVGGEIKLKNKGLKETNLLSLSYGEVVNRDIDSNEGLLPESFDGYQIIQPFDLVFRFTDLQNDQKSLRTAISRSTGIITSAYLAVRTTSQNPNFLAFLMRGYDLLKVFYAMGGGLRQSMKFDDIRRLPLFFPDLQEQEKIVEFLTKTTIEIDLLKAKAADMVQLLQERRQALISAAVTGKIDVRGN